MAGRKGKTDPAKLIKIAVAAVVVLVVAGLTANHFISAKREAAAIAEMWTVTGPPCPTPPAGAAFTPPAKGTEYEGVTFQRERDQINCSTIHPGGGSEAVPVCMFMQPTSLRVTTSAGTFDYVLGRGVPATVYVRKGQAQCVANFNRALF